MWVTLLECEIDFVSEENATFFLGVVRGGLGWGSGQPGPHMTGLFSHLCACVAWSIHRQDKFGSANSNLTLLVGPSKSLFPVNGGPNSRY